MAQSTEDKVVAFDRTYDASPEAVWRAWTEPARLKEWWGPEGVTIPECEVDLSLGGRFYIVMEAGEAMGPYKGTRWPMEATYTAIEPAAKLAYESKAWTEGDEEATRIEQSAELTLTEENGGTKMHLTITVTSIGPRAGAAIEGMQWGFNQQFDKLEKYLGAS